MENQHSTKSRDFNVYVYVTVIPLSFNISSPRISKSGGRHPFFMTFLLVPVSNSMVNFSFELSNSEIVGQFHVICREEYISNSFGFFFPRFPLTCKSGWFLATRRRLASDVFLIYHVGAISGRSCRSVSNKMSLRLTITACT